MHPSVSSSLAVMALGYYFPLYLNVNASARMVEGLLRGIRFGEFEEVLSFSNQVAEKVAEKTRYEELPTPEVMGSHRETLEGPPCLASDTCPLKQYLLRGFPLVSSQQALADFGEFELPTPPSRGLPFHDMEAAVKDMMDEGYEQRLKELDSLMTGAYILQFGGKGGKKVENARLFLLQHHSAFIQLARMFTRYAIPIFRLYKLRQGFEAQEKKALQRLAMTFNMRGGAVASSTADADSLSSFTSLHDEEGEITSRGSSKSTPSQMDLQKQVAVETVVKALEDFHGFSVDPLQNAEQERGLIDFMGVEKKFPFLWEVLKANFGGQQGKQKVN